MVSGVRGGNVTRVFTSGPFEEHPDVARTITALATRARDGHASSISFLPQRGVAFQAYAFAYRTGLSKELNVPAQPTRGLKGTLLIHASGHTKGELHDRVTGWAAQQLRQRGVVVDEAATYLGLEAASRGAVATLAQGAASAHVSFAGERLVVSRALFAKLQRASTSSSDSELAALGRLGDESLRQHYAATNAYEVHVRAADGTSRTLRVARNRPEQLELVTRVAIELPVAAGDVVLEAWPEGSSGVAAYPEARRYRVHIGSALFSVASARAAAVEYEARHPEVRWHTEHEATDLERLGVAPSPRPFADG